MQILWWNKMDHKEEAEKEEVGGLVVANTLYQQWEK